MKGWGERGLNRWGTGGLHPNGTSGSNDPCMSQRRVGPKSTLVHVKVIPRSYQGHPTMSGRVDFPITSACKPWSIVLVDVGKNKSGATFGFPIHITNAVGHLSFYMA